VVNSDIVVILWYPTKESGNFQTASYLKQVITSKYSKSGHLTIFLMDQYALFRGK